ncbi:hypothetical protein EVAR_73169_1 [Eumeta japonica]|uniref:Uncharacterized protein n=1 Tax=Eumeta variegata TaxID=151549 RepID=A0A4C1SQ82_EUMVA|nr:hypothetical protein EVAR_73169_1 [Eumeta japonica]
MEEHIPILPRIPFGMHSTLEMYLRKVVSISQKEWEEHIPIFILAYRSAVYDSTTRTPAKIVFGTELKSPGGLQFGVQPSPPNKATENTSQAREELDEAHNFVRSRIKMTRDKIKAKYDLAANSDRFTEMQLVLLCKPQRKKDYLQSCKPFGMDHIG